MNDARGPEGRDGTGVDLRQLARDWITICRSELAALAADREVQETWQALLALWAGAAEAILAAQQGAHDRSGRRTGTADAPRTSAAAAAPDPRDAEIERLSGRVAELERRLGELERMGRGGGRGRRKAAPPGG